MFGIGDVIRRLRKTRGWTQVELARASGGLSPETIVRIEKGQVTTTDTLARVATALGCTLADLYAQVTSPPRPTSPPVSNVEDGTIDVSDYTPHDIPVIAEGEASPQGSLFWTDEGILQRDVEDRISRPHDVTDPRAYGVKVRGDSMLPIFKPGMILIVSPNVSVNDGDEVYVELLSGERLVKTARRASDGWWLESANPAYERRFVPKEAIGTIHPVLYARRRRTPNHA